MGIIESTETLLFCGVKVLFNKLNETRADINAWCNKLQYKNNEELEKIVAFDSNISKRLAAKYLLKKTLA